MGRRVVERRRVRQLEIAARAAPRSCPTDCGHDRHPPVVAHPGTSQTDHQSAIRALPASLRPTPSRTTGPELTRARRVDGRRCVPPARGRCFNGRWKLRRRRAPSGAGTPPLTITGRWLCLVMDRRTSPPLRPGIGAGKERGQPTVHPMLATIRPTDSAAVSNARSVARAAADFAEAVASAIRRSSQRSPALGSSMSTGNARPRRRRRGRARTRGHSRPLASR